MNCGTRKGWENHKSTNTRVCKWCEPYDPKLANPKKEVVVRTKPGPKPTTTACGTRGGYLRHWKASEESCQPCLDAANQYAKERRDKNGKPKLTPSGLVSRAKPRSEWKTPVHKPIPCGTYAAAARHARKGEEMDDACRQARRDYDNANKKAKRGPRKPPVPCGTSGASDRHRKAGEKCQTCSDAENQRARERRAKKKVATQ